MADDSRISFHGSPTGARTVEITWIAKDTGRFGRDSRVARNQASHARIREWGGSKAGERVVTVTEADAYIRELEAYGEQQASADEDRKRRLNAWLETLCSTCPHCQTPRVYSGVEQLQEGSRATVALLGEWATSNVNVHVYQCAYCGSMELFRDGGPIAHPLAGNRPAQPA
jgi:hypothetical protein